MGKIRTVKQILFRKLKRVEEKDNQGKEEDNDNPEGPCNKTGHIWEECYSPDYYAHIRGINSDKVKLKKKKHYRCSKCGKYRNENEIVDKAKINKNEDKIVA